MDNYNYFEHHNARLYEEAIEIYKNRPELQMKCLTPTDSCSEPIISLIDPEWKAEHRNFFIHLYAFSLCGMPYLAPHFCNYHFNLGIGKPFQYQAYILSPKWKLIRRMKLDQAGYCCELCFASDKILHVHHKTYRHLANEAFNELIVLCADCHAKFHDKLPESE